MTLRITPLTDPAPRASGYRLVWQATGEEDYPLGSAGLVVHTAPGLDHSAHLDIRVHPAERRRGVGTRLLAAALAAARESDRRSLVGWVRADSPGGAFLEGHGFSPVLSFVHTRLELAEVDPAGLAGGIQQPHPGYRLTSWDGLVPDDLAAAYLAALGAMDDQPTGDEEAGAMVWDLDRLETAVAAIDRRGERLHTVAAVDESDGTVAGFTELVCPVDGGGEGRHYGTGVLPRHRGRGLARWMKLASIAAARERHPDLAGLLTDTAEENHAMRRVNDALGYRTTHTATEYRLSL
ncbi:GNAT family N-acetyltransferase [Kitasatospora sp. NPDC096147]|uniref:GNAT family N-acetyltransferase n=1 Tax=Kitasatospora sp. NPDC096147 TaxID=3364093 RepID=UPI00382CC727